jgi:hypothetical protein
MKRSLLGAVVLVAAGRATCSQTLTGNDLYGQCFDNTGNANVNCTSFATAYVLGLIQGQRDAHLGYLLCVPPSVTGGQLTLIVQKAMRDHPDLLNQSAGFIVLKAVAEHYTCKPGQSPTYGDAPN